ncbi:hypothetical protein [Halomarina oriensis]|uniref:Uncharacterized protein n=1 Tax=Halomarina oriensis TaxID=671145 RepID=A0A6B0GM33_9EURY|nr:hypothetical protein [Halomarina oriensis]MWG35912.1 hypothetical protein [Halomarina oriensis]
MAVDGPVPIVTAGDCACGGAFLVTADNDRSPLVDTVEVPCSNPACDWTKTVSQRGVDSARERALAERTDRPDDGGRTDDRTHDGSDATDATQNMNPRTQPQSTDHDQPAETEAQR